MQYTENIDLLKPDQNDQYDVGDFNRNFDTLDTHIHNLETGADDLREELARVEHDDKQFSNMEGVCGISQGGTGKTTAQAALDELHKDIVPTGTIADTDEITFLKRTQGENDNPDTVAAKSILLDDLALVIFELIRGNTGVFSSTKNGFVPKSLDNNAKKFLRADGTWGVPEGIETGEIDVDSSTTQELNSDMIFRIREDSTTIVNDPERLMVRATFINETNRSQNVRLKLKGGNAVYKLNKGKVWQMVWNGSFWMPAYEEIPVGTVRETISSTAEDGWFLCDGTDTTGTQNELASCFPNLYEKLGNTNILPDYRECALVGAGQNGTDTMGTHDVFTVGQYKDDQNLNHTHTRGTMEIYGGLFDVFGPQNGPVCRGEGAFNAGLAGQREDVTPMGGVPSGIGAHGTLAAYYAWFYASRHWTGATSGQDGRTGSVARGKRKGVNFMIKA